MSFESDTYSIGSSWFRFAYDFDSDGVFDLGDGTFRGSVREASALVPAEYLADGPAAREVRGRVIYKDTHADFTTIVSVENLAPGSLDAGGPYSVSPGGSLTLSGSAVDPAGEADPLTFSWDINGDGEFGDAAGPNPTIDWAQLTELGVQPGSTVPNLTVRVSDDDGGVSEATTTLTVEESDESGPTITAFEVPESASEGDAIALSADAEGEANPLSFVWRVTGPGLDADFNGPNVTIELPDDGDYAVTLTVTDGANRTSTQTATVTSANVAPEVNTGGPYAGLEGHEIALTGSASDAPADVESLTYHWEFGDGDSAAGSEAAHAYASPGTYQATLTVTDKDGASASRNVLVSVVSLNQSDGVTITPDFITTHHDRIPNFGGHPTIASVQSGNWSDAATWGGQLPVAGDVVSIDPGTVVTYDVGPSADNPALDTVVIQETGALRFRTDVDTQMRVVNLLVFPGGELTVGTQADPVHASVRAEIRFPDVALDLENDPAQFGNGLIAFGKVHMHGAEMSDTFVRLATEPRAGDTTLTLSVPVSGWRPGDKLALPDTRQISHLTNNTEDRWEVATVSSVSQDGLTVTLTAPLQHDHLGARAVDGSLTFLPHVANQQRNVLVRSEDMHGTRGHTMFSARADIDIRYSQFAGLGRTTNGLLDNTTFDAQGNVTHVGTNQKARYPVHFHHLIGPASAQSNGYQFTFQGNSVTCPLSPMPFRWGITIHGSHYGLVSDNVVYNWAGAGIVTEDGSETGNVIEGNFVSRITGTGSRGDDRLWGWAGFDGGHEGTGIWNRGQNNHVHDNVVTNARKYGYNYFAKNLSIRMVPLFQGANPHMEGQGVEADMRTTPVREFVRNEVYGMTNTGLTIWNIGSGTTAIATEIPQSVMADFSAWHTNIAYYGYPTNNFLFDGWVVRGDLNTLANHHNLSDGLYFGDYLTANFTARDADIQGLRAGVILPFKQGDVSSTGDVPQTTLIEDSYLANVTNVSAAPMYGVTGGGISLSPRLTILRNVMFGSPSSDHLGNRIHFDIKMNFIPRAPNGNVIQTDEVFVENYNGVQGDDFQVYYAEQAADFIVPQSGSLNGLVGSPEAGLTNQQNWDLYGIAIAGAVLPSDAVERDGINGFVRPL